MDFELPKTCSQCGKEQPLIEFICFTREYYAGRPKVKILNLCNKCRLHPRKKKHENYLILNELTRESIYAILEFQSRGWNIEVGKAQPLPSNFVGLVPKPNAPAHKAYLTKVSQEGMNITVRSNRGIWAGAIIISPDEFFELYEKGYEEDEISRNAEKEVKQEVHL
jgi:hypothetical protein